ncbi:hypothetical protein BV898_05673 [Hypsibius exemplaris]|uniref:Fucolectin tachylectin-4 pentraxin-1 domain-containing protein n=1 Tax=Hypsibius exemplaris TaxID=2072580 RepID=A0A1W0WYV9_HYPEX|nr:hypothetical protein BV898_05673 [Hypsibius exemplaris]
MRDRLGIVITYRLLWMILILPCIVSPDIDVVNSALNKPAIQSSTFRDNQELFGSHLANDASHLTCSKTQWSWTLFWRVDLKEMLPIVGSNITLRWEYFDKFLYRIDLQIGEENIPFADACGTKTLYLDRPDDYQLELICANVTAGRFVTISVAPNYAGKVTTGSPQLTLCDVKVFTLPKTTVDRQATINSTASDELSADANFSHDAAASQNSEFTAHYDDDAAARANLDQDGLLFLSEIGTPEQNRTLSTPPPPPRRKKIFRERVKTTTRTRIERLLKQMQPPLSSTTSRREQLRDDDFDLREHPGEPIPSLFPESGLSAEMGVWKDEILGKLHAVHGYVVFAGIAIGILLILALVMGFIILWSLTCKTSSNKKDQTRSTTIHEFSFKAPSPPPPPQQQPVQQSPEYLMDRSKNFFRVKEFPKDSVPRSRGIF